MAKFIVSYTFHARCTADLEAGSLEEAKRIIAAKVDADNFELDADEIDDVDFRIQEMHPVTRDGKKMWTSYVRADDVRGHDEVA